MENLRKLILLFVVMIVCTAFIPGGRVSAASDTAGDSLKILGHASVKIKTSDGMVIYIDPFAGTDYADSADVLLVTHQHGDHNAVHLVKRKQSCVTITNAEAQVAGVYQHFAVGNITIDAVPAYNANHQKNSCVGYVLEFSDIRLYHAGDTGLIDEMSDLKDRHITHALLPMDGIYTMTPEEAVEAAVRMDPAHTIPIHTIPPPGTFSEAIVDRFTAPSKLVVRPGETIELISGSTAIEGESSLPRSFFLKQNYPNPFNPGTSIEFSIPEAGYTVLRVYDMLGKEAAVLVSERLGPGLHRAEFDGSRMQSGVYIVKLASSGRISSGRMLLLK
ncbi:MBL fold metallo-hydrolase [bacterium]|nr:MBL fold metallo-hydrolase [bacterium]